MCSSGGGSRPDKNLFAFLELELIVQRFSILAPRMLKSAATEQPLQLSAPKGWRESFHALQANSQPFQLGAKFE
ncbi:hypothetical protein SAMN05216476_5711 [Pseudomonas mediterranea]|uniref:Uncharacterized protein n=1 Tax=Pseudomonas mediterranea TaxID=183795 RepID=A0AAX2DJT8_9PSED|nr:hypothetical protein SAMN05216476_5711 [Pseudomonas mediterranea]